MKVGRPDRFAACCASVCVVALVLMRALARAEPEDAEAYGRVTVPAPAHEGWLGAVERVCGNKHPANPKPTFLIVESRANREQLDHIDSVPFLPRNLAHIPPVHSETAVRPSKYLLRRRTL